MGTLVKEFLSAEYPEIDTGSGRVLSKLLLDPAEAVADELVALQSEEYMKQSWAAAIAGSLTADQLTNLKSTYLAGTGADGSCASGSVRITTSTAQPFVVPVDASFVSDADIAYSPASALVVSTADSADAALVASGSSFYVDIPVTAVTAGVSGNLAAGSSLTWEAAPTSVTGVTCLTAMSGGTAAETAEAALALVKEALSLHSPVSSYSISRVVRAADSLITDVKCVAAGDPLLTRDMDSNGVSVGGCVDVYVKTQPVLNTVSVSATLQDATTKKLTAYLPVSSSSGVFTCYPLTASGDQITARTVTVAGIALDDHRMTADDGILGSAQNFQIDFVDQTLDVTELTAGSVVTYNLAVYCVAGVAAAQAALDDDDTGVLCVDYLVRAATPVACAFSCVLGSSAAAADILAARQAVAALILAAPISSPIPVSRLTAKVMSITGCDVVGVPSLGMRVFSTPAGAPYAPRSAFDADDLAGTGVYAYYADLGDIQIG